MYGDSYEQVEFLSFYSRCVIWVCLIDPVPRTGYYSRGIVSPPVIRQFPDPSTKRKTTSHLSDPTTGILECLPGLVYLRSSRQVHSMPTTFDVYYGCGVEWSHPVYVVTGSGRCRDGRVRSRFSNLVGLFLGSRRR